MTNIALPYSTTFELEGTPPYSFGLTLHKPAGWSFLTPFEIFENDTLWSAMRMDSNKLYGLKLKSVGSMRAPKVLCTVFSRENAKTAEKRSFAETIRWILELDKDIQGFYRLARRDHLVNMLVKDLCGMKEAKRPDIFPSLILAVTLQMAPINRSDQMMSLLITEYGDKAIFDGKEIAYWPSPAKIAKAKTSDLKKKCKVGYRAKALKGIARAIVNGFPNVKELEQLSEQQAKARLMDLKGIGEYSAEIVSPHPGFPLDLWSAKIFGLLIWGKQAPSPRKIIPELRKIALEKWGIWRGHVFIYVLNDLEKLSKRLGYNFTEL